MSLLGRLADALWNPWLLGALSVHRSDTDGGERVLSPAALPAVVAGDRREPAPHQPRLQRRRHLLPPGPGHRPGLHHRHGQHRRGGHGHLSGRAGAVFWMWVSALLGMSTGVCGKTAVRAVSDRRPQGRAAGRPHVLPAGRPPRPRAGRLVLPGLPPRHPGGGQPGPGGLHRLRPPVRLRLGPIAGGGGDSPAGRAGDGGRHGPGGPGVGAAGARHGPAVPGKRRPGADRPGGGAAPGLCPHLLLRP